MRDYELMMQSIVEKRGGFREKEILNGEYTVHKTRQWNSEHKVLSVLDVRKDIYGHRDGFQVDLVTRKICG